jgi:hypothetical protein
MSAPSAVSPHHTQTSQFTGKQNPPTDYHHPEQPSIISFEIMAQAFPNGFAIDQPTGSSQTNPYAAEAWVEPWLLKHSSFYRKHFTRDGRTESKASRRASVITAELESRRNSVAAPSEASRDSVSEEAH